MRHEQGLNSRRSSMQTRESTKYHGTSRECRCVEVDAKQFINSSKSCRRTRHRVIGRRKSIEILIPWRRARKDELYANANDVHVAEAACEHWDGSGWSEDEHND